MKNVTIIPGSMHYKEIVYTFLFLVAFLCTSCLNSSKQTFGGGSGTETNPYQISTIEQLQAIDDLEYLDKHFIQVADIDATPSEDFQNGSGFKQIGTKEFPFTGVYNGNGYKIIDLKIHFNKFDKHNGLFGYIKNARLENITVDNSSYLSNNKPGLKDVDHASFYQRTAEPLKAIPDLSNAGGIGGLAGFNDGGVISNCSFYGYVSGHISQTVGGLVGLNNGLIEDSYFEGSAGSGGVAGLVVWNVGNIINSHVYGQFDGMAAYGFTAINYGKISQSSATIKVWGSHTTTGLVGANEGGLIEASYATGLVRSSHRAAGLVAYNRGIVRNSYSHVTVEYSPVPGFDPLRVAGLVTENEPGGVIEYSFAIGEIEISGNGGIVSAVAVLNEGTITASYWDTETTGQNEGVGEGNPADATGLTTQQMTGPAAEVNMPEFDWQTVWRTTNGYPVLRWQEE